MWHKYYKVIVFYWILIKMILLCNILNKNCVQFIWTSVFYRIDANGGTYAAGVCQSVRRSKSMKTTFWNRNIDILFDVCFLMINSKFYVEGFQKKKRKKSNKSISIGFQWQKQKEMCSCKWFWPPIPNIFHCVGVRLLFL